jgi:hypothetical protein
MSPQAVRPLSLTAMVGGALYVVAGLVQLTSPEQSDPFSRTSDYLIEALLALSSLLTLAGFVALHLLLRAGGYRGLRGWTGFRAAALGQGAMFVSTVVSLVTGSLALGFLYFAGVCLLLVGLALLPVADLQGGNLASLERLPSGCPRRDHLRWDRGGRGRCGLARASLRPTFERSCDGGAILTRREMNSAEFFYHALG